MSIQELESTALVRMDGELDMARTGELIATVAQVDLDPISVLILDLQDVEFLDLAALNTILEIRDRCEAHGVHLTVIGPRGPAGRIIVLAHAHEVLDLV